MPCGSFFDEDADCVCAPADTAICDINAEICEITSMKTVRVAQRMSGR